MAIKIHETNNMWHSWTYRDYDQVPPFRSPPQSDIQHDLSAYQLSASGDEHCKTYIKCLKHLISHVGIAANNEPNLPLLSMLPLLHLKATFLHQKSELARRYCTNPNKYLIKDILDGSSYFTVKRFELRRHIEEFEADRIRFINYACGKQQETWLTDSACRRVDCVWKDIFRDARHIEAEIRDNLQILAGQSSPEESKKSIEISNYQIQEGKRGK